MEFEDEDHDEDDLEQDEDEDEETTTLLTPIPTPTFNNKKHYSTLTRYKECLKNHAVTIGGHAVDGCGEFMPAGPNNSIDSLKCAACNCHRNFHRRELFLDTSQQHLTVYSPRPPFGGPGPGPGGPVPPHVYQFYPYNRTTPNTPPSRALPLSSPLEEHVTMTSSSGKKRHRTKFSQEQKDKMLELAEGLGWRIQKQDETVVQQFCDQAGIRRHVLKVWMHNNKHTLGKKLLPLCDNPSSVV